MKSVSFLIIAVLCLLTGAACAGRNEPGEREEPLVQGPAFILFYTDN